MRKISMLALAVVLGLAAVMACERDAEDVAEERAEAIEDWTDARQEQWQEQMDARLNGYQTRLDEWEDELQRKGDDLSAEARQQWNETIADLRTNLEKARAETKELGDRTGEAWVSAKDNLENAANELGQAFDDAADKFKD